MIEKLSVEWQYYHQQSLEIIQVWQIVPLHRIDIVKFLTTYKWKKNQFKL